MTLSAISTYGLSILPTEFDNSVANPFANLLTGIDIQLNYLIELKPFNPNSEFNVFGNPVSAIPVSGYPLATFRGAVETVYLSDRGYYTSPSENPPNTSYLPLVDNPFQFDISILNGRDFRGGSPAFGAIRIASGDGSLDDLVDYLWSGRQITIYAGGNDFTRSQYEAVFNGIVNNIEYDEDEIIVNISDKSEILRTSFDQSLYAGTGGLEGGADIEGNAKPLCYGQVKNVPLKLVDAGLNIYQVHDGAIEEVTAVYDRGVDLNNQGDVADITATTVSGGNFKTQLSGGYIRLGGNPDGTVTADVKGDNTGGYVDKAGAILSRLVSTKLGGKNFTSNDIDQGALNALDTSLNAPLGIYILEKTQLDAVLNNLFVNLNCYWYFKREGQISAGIIDTPSIETATIDENTIIDDSFEVVQSIPATWRITAGYAKNWQVQNLDTLAASATSDQKSFAINEYRNLVLENRTVRGQTLNDNELVFNSYLINESDAQDYLDRLARIYQENRKVYKLKVTDLLFKVYIGDTIKIRYPRFGLENGKNFIITSIAEDAQENETEIEVWG